MRRRLDEGIMYLMDELAYRRDQRAMRQAIEETFTPWPQDPIRLARLWRFLEVIEETPVSVPDFLEHPEVYADRYEEMCAIDGRRV